MAKSNPRKGVSDKQQRRIAKDAGVVGGSARIRNTRIPVWVLENYRRLGMTDRQLLEGYPTLTSEDLIAAWEYAESHKKEIDRLIKKNEQGDEGFAE